MDNPQPDTESFNCVCRQFNLDITPDQFARLRYYIDLICEWNTRINLVSRKDTERLLSYHIIDSLAASPLIHNAALCADIGTGAGLPGIPLAIARPDIRMILVESTGKKCLFLERCITALSLGSITVINERAEKLPPLNCNVILSRLTGPFPKIVRQLARHVSADGSIVMFKNPTANDNMTSHLLDKFHLELHHIVDLILPFSGVPRRFVVLCRKQPLVG